MVTFLSDLNLLKISGLQVVSIISNGKRGLTHKFLRRTRSLIKNVLPNLFHYLDDSKIPKSTNGIETRFSYLKNNLKIHIGLTKKTDEILFSDIIILSINFRHL